MESLHLDSLELDSVSEDNNLNQSKSIQDCFSKCNIHPNKVVDLYCKACNQPACSDCVVGRHVQCNANLCSLKDALVQRKLAVAKHKDALHTALKKISDARSQMLSEASVKKDAFSVIKKEVLKCEADAIHAIKIETRKILDSLERVCNQEQSSMQSLLFNVATIVDGSMNVLNATDSLLQLSESMNKSQTSNLAISTPNWSRSHEEHYLQNDFQKYEVRKINTSPVFRSILTNGNINMHAQREDTKDTVQTEDRNCFQDVADDKTFPRVKQLEKNNLIPERPRMDCSYKEVFTKYGQTETEIKKPIPTKIKFKQPILSSELRTKPNHQSIKNGNSLSVSFIKQSDSHERSSAFSPVKPQGINECTGIKTSCQHVNSHESQVHIETKSNKSESRSPNSSSKPRVRHSPLELMGKLLSLSTRRGLQTNCSPEFYNKTAVDRNTFRFTPKILCEIKAETDRVEIVTELSTKPVLIKTLQLPVEDETFQSVSTVKMRNIGQRLSSTDSTKLVGVLERPPVEVTFQPHQLDIAVVQPDDSVVVADGWNSCLIAFAKEGDYYHPTVMELSFDPCCLAEVGNNTVAVTGGTDITFIKVKPRVMVDKTLYTQKYYQGIARLATGKIAVSYTPNGIVERYVHIDVLTFNGDLLQTIQTEIDPDVYKTRLCCNHKEDFLLACCSFGGRVAFLQKADKYACKFEIDLAKPWSVAFDQNAHIYIVDGDKDHRRLVRTRQDGSRPEVILSADNGNTVPASVVFGHDGFMYVTQCDGSIKIFQMVD